MNPNDQNGIVDEDVKTEAESNQSDYEEMDLEGIMDLFANPENEVMKEWEIVIHSEGGDEKGSKDSISIVGGSENGDQHVPPQKKCRISSSSQGKYAVEMRSSQAKDGMNAIRSSQRKLVSKRAKKGDNYKTSELRRMVDSKSKLILSVLNKFHHMEVCSDVTFDVTLRIPPWGSSHPDRILHASSTGFVPPLPVNDKRKRPYLRQGLTLKNVTEWKDGDCGSSGEESEGEEDHLEEDSDQGEPTGNEQDPKGSNLVGGSENGNQHFLPRNKCKVSGSSRGKHTVEMRSSQAEDGMNAVRSSQRKLLSKKEKKGYKTSEERRLVDNRSKQIFSVLNKVHYMEVCFDVTFDLTLRIPLPKSGQPDRILHASSTGFVPPLPIDDRRKRPYLRQGLTLKSATEWKDGNYVSSSEESEGEQDQLEDDSVQGEPTGNERGSKDSICTAGRSENGDQRVPPEKKCKISGSSQGNYPVEMRSSQAKDGMNAIRSLQRKPVSKIARKDYKTSENTRISVNRSKRIVAVLNKIHYTEVCFDVKYDVTLRIPSPKSGQPDRILHAASTDFVPPRPVKNGRKRPYVRQNLTLKNVTEWMDGDCGSSGEESEGEEDHLEEDSDQGEPTVNEEDSEDNVSTVEGSDNGDQHVPPLKKCKISSSSQGRSAVEMRSSQVEDGVNAVQSSQRKLVLSKCEKKGDKTSEQRRMVDYRSKLIVVVLNKIHYLEVLSDVTFDVTLRIPSSKSGQPDRILHASSTGFVPPLRVNGRRTRPYERQGLTLKNVTKWKDGDCVSSSEESEGEQDQLEDDSVQGEPTGNEQGSKDSICTAGGSGNGDQHVPPKKKCKISGSSQGKYPVEMRSSQAENGMNAVQSSQRKLLSKREKKGSNTSEHKRMVANRSKGIVAVLNKIHHLEVCSNVMFDVTLRVPSSKSGEPDRILHASSTGFVPPLPVNDKRKQLFERQNLTLKNVTEWKDGDYVSSGEKSEGEEDQFEEDSDQGEPTGNEQVNVPGVPPASPGVMEAEEEVEIASRRSSRGLNFKPVNFKKLACNLKSCGVYYRSAADKIFCATKKKQKIDSEWIYCEFPGEERNGVKYRCKHAAHACCARQLGITDGKFLCRYHKRGSSNAP